MAASERLDTAGFGALVLLCWTIYWMGEIYKAHRCSTHIFQFQIMLSAERIATTLCHRYSSIPEQLSHIYVVHCR